MKNINEIIPAIKYNSIEVFNKINKLEELHTKINVLEFDVKQLQTEHQELLNNLCLNIYTFKSILEKLKTCYIAYISYHGDLKEIRILSFKPAEDINFNVEEYANNHLKKYELKSFAEYEISTYVSEVKISDEKIIQKHVYITNKPSYGINLKNLLIILSSNSGYFINKMEFNKYYELRSK